MLTYILIIEDSASLSGIAATGTFSGKTATMSGSSKLCMGYGIGCNCEEHRQIVSVLVRPIDYLRTADITAGTTAITAVTAAAIKPSFVCGSVSVSPSSTFARV